MSRYIEIKKRRCLDKKKAPDDNRNMHSSSIADIIDSERLPRIGIVRLGLRGSSEKISAVDHFIFDVKDEGLAKRTVEVYGTSPSTIDISLHNNDLSKVFTSE